MEKSKSPVTHFLHRNDRLRTIVRHNGVFCSEKQVNKQRVFMPHEPQPAGDEILELHRLYQNLVASDPESKQFKRRFTWVDSVPTTIPRVPTNVAVVEYIGTFPARLLHGNAKNKETNSDYIRTKDSVLTHLKSQLKDDTVKAVERHMNTITKGDFLKQRNDKQLDNLKYQINRYQNLLPSSINNRGSGALFMGPSPHPRRAPTPNL